MYFCWSNYSSYIGFSWGLFFILFSKMLSANRIKCVPMPELVITSCLHSISYIASKFSDNNIRWLNFLSEWCASLLLFNTRTRKKIAICVSSLLLSTACCWKWSIKIFVSLEKKTSYQERGNTWRGDCSLAIRPRLVFVSLYRFMFLDLFGWCVLKRGYWPWKF